MQPRAVMEQLLSARSPRNGYAGQCSGAVCSYEQVYLRQGSFTSLKLSCAALQETMLKLEAVKLQIEKQKLENKIIMETKRVQSQTQQWELESAMSELKKHMQVRPSCCCVGCAQALPCPALAPALGPALVPTFSRASALVPTFSRASAHVGAAS